MDAELASRKLTNEISRLDDLSSLLEEAVEKLQVPPRCLYEVTLALEEIFTNIVKYAYDDDAGHLIHVIIGQKGKDALVIRFEDDGQPFDPTQARDPDLDLPVEERPVGKLGVFIVKKIMDSMAYERVEGKNILTLIKTLRPDACVIG